MTLTRGTPCKICHNTVCFLISVLLQLTVACMGEVRVVHRVLVGKPEGKRPLGRPRLRWEDNIKMDHSGNGRGLWGLDGVGSG